MTAAVTATTTAAELDLPFIWAALIAFAVLAYVLLDGFDLGIGILFPFLDGGAERDDAMNSVAPVWDGNETWLVLGGGGLFAVFPLAYAIVMPALYAPILAMLMALAFRGVAFEFRFRTRRGQFLWDISFALGSTVASFAQGVALGALVQGIPVVERSYAGGWWDWLTPFSLLTGVSLVIGYALLGALWLNWKTSGSLQHRARKMAIMLAPAVLALIGLVSLWTPLLNDVYRERWFAWPTVLLGLPVPLLTLLAGWLVYSGLKTGREALPFLAGEMLFVLCFAGLGISFYPHIVPNSLTIWQAAAPAESQGFLLAGAVLLLPIILAYTGYSYWVFRGKVQSGGGYH